MQNEAGQRLIEFLQENVKVKEESEKVDLKLNIQKTEIMASGPIASWQIEYGQETALIRANTLFQQHKRRLYTWTSPDGQHQNQPDYSLCSQRWRSSIQSAKIRPVADCGSHHELFIAKFRLKLKKVGKNTRPFNIMT